MQSITDQLRDKFKENLWFNNDNNSYCYSLINLGNPWTKLNLNSGGDPDSYYVHFNFESRKIKNKILLMLASDSYSVWKANSYLLDHVIQLTINVFLDNPGKNYLELNGVQDLELHFTADNLILFCSNNEYILDEAGLNAIGANINSTLLVNISHLYKLRLVCLNQDNRPLKVTPIDYPEQGQNASAKLNSLGTNFSYSNMPQAELVYSNADSLRNVHAFEEIAQKSHENRNKKMKLMAGPLDVATDLMALTSMFLGKHERPLNNLMDKTTQSRDARMKRKEYLENIRKIKKASKKAEKAEGFKKRKPKKTLKRRKSRK